MDGTSSIWLCDEDYNVIKDFPFAYSRFKKGNPRWVTLRVKPIEVPSTFVICAGFNPEQTKGVYVHYDDSGSGNSFTGLPGKEMPVFNDGEWMIRAVVQQPRTESGPTVQVILKDSLENGTDVPTGWEKGKNVNGVEYIWDKNNGSDGRASLCLKKTASRYFSIAQWTRKIEHKSDASKLTVSAQVKAENATKAVLDALFLDESNKRIKHEWVSYIGRKKEENIPAANHDWKAYSGIVEIPEKTKTVVIGLQIYGPGTVWFDELEVAYLRESEEVKGKNDRIVSSGRGSKTMAGKSASSQTSEVGSPAKSVLQRLIDSAPTGETVIVPKGIYTEPVTITKPLTLKGQSRNDCVFEVTADQPAIFIDTKGKGRVTIEGLTIKWKLATSDRAESAFALGVKDSKVEVKNCSFVPLGNFKRSPMAIRAIGFSNVDVNICRFEGFGFAVFYNEGTEGAIRDSLIMNCQSQGITIFSGATVDIVGNIITGSKKHAVRNTGGTLRMKDNLIINNANRGIYLGNKSAKGTIINNIIMGNGTGISGFARSKVVLQRDIFSLIRHTTL